MYVLFDNHSKRIITTGDRIDCLTKAIFSSPLGRPTGHLEQIESRLQQIEQTLATILSTMPDDALNAFLSAKGLLIYNDDTVPTTRLR